MSSSSPVVLPSLLLCDFGNLQREVARLESAGIRALHLDVMDGHFVHNLSYGLPIVEALRRLTDLPLDVHLMIANPGDYIEEYFDAGADGLTIHAEAVDDPRPLLERIGQLGAATGLAINPKTPVLAIEACLDLCDLILVMSVEPGFGDQKFMPVALEKLRTLRELCGGRMLLEVDGGVNPSTIGPCAEAGATLFVAGSAIFDHDDYTQSVQELTELAAFEK